MASADERGMLAGAQAAEGSGVPAELPVAIIGWGTAGANAAIGLRQAGYAGRIVAFSDTDIPPYSPILTSYFVGGEKAYDQCFPWSAAELADLDVDVLGGCKVELLDPQARRIACSTGQEFGYRTCIVAVGARPSTAGFPADCGYQPLVLRTMDDAQRMKRAFERPGCRRVLVSGASMIALKCVEAALNNGLDVSLVGVNDHILDFSAMPQAAHRFERGLAAQGVGMRFNCSIAQVRRTDDGDLEVAFSNGETQRFDEVVVAHGVRSDLSFIKEGSVSIDRALVVDRFMRTSAEGLYAAGDAAQALELISGEPRVLGIWKTAALQGACAGAAAAAELAGRQPSEADAYPGAIMTNAIAVNGTLFMSAGVSQAGSNQRADVREDDRMTVVRIFQAEPDGSERLVGFNVASDVDEPGGAAYDIAAMLTLRIEQACRS